MNGPEHYQAAERLAADARAMVRLIADTEGRDARQAQALVVQVMLVEAQVHVGLAAVAAQADPDRVTVTRAATWRAVLS